MKNLAVYVHGKGGSPAEAEHFHPLLSNCEILGFDYHSATPWDAKNEFLTFFAGCKKQFDSITLIANSIGAYFSMCALTEKEIDRAFFISPVVDLQKLTEDMMLWAGVTKEDLEARKIIETPFGETLSWEYYTYLCSHPVQWDVPTEILYGANDILILRETVAAFAEKHHAGLTVMENGEHWFHTLEQMQFLDDWIRQKTKGAN